MSLTSSEYPNRHRLATCILEKYWHQVEQAGTAGCFACGVTNRFVSSGHTAYHTLKTLLGRRMLLVPPVNVTVRQESKDSKIWVSKHLCLAETAVGKLGSPGLSKADGPRTSMSSLLTYLNGQQAHETYLPVALLTVIHAVRVTIVWSQACKGKDRRQASFLQGLLGYLTLACTSQRMQS